MKPVTTAFYTRSWIPTPKFSLFRPSKKTIVSPQNWILNSNSLNINALPAYAIQAEYVDNSLRLSIWPGLKLKLNIFDEQDQAEKHPLKQQSNNRYPKKLELTIIWIGHSIRNDKMSLIQRQEYLSEDILKQRITIEPTVVITAIALVHRIHQFIY